MPPALNNRLVRLPILVRIESASTRNSALTDASCLPNQADDLCNRGCWIIGLQGYWGIWIARIWSAVAHEVSAAGIKLHIRRLDVFERPA